MFDPTINLEKKSNIKSVHPKRIIFTRNYENCRYLELSHGCICKKLIFGASFSLAPQNERIVTISISKYIQVLFKKVLIHMFIQ